MIFELSATVVSFPFIEKRAVNCVYSQSFLQISGVIVMDREEAGKEKNIWLKMCVICEQENTNNFLLELKSSWINTSDLPSLAENELFFQYLMALSC